MKRRFFFKLLAVTFVLLAVGPSTGNDQLRTIAVTGDAAPGTESGVQFDNVASFDLPAVLNNRGDVALHAFLTGTGPSLNFSGVWSEGGGNGLELVARAGSIAPGTNANFSANVINSLGGEGSPLVINGNGQTAFNASLDTLQSGAGVWSEVQGNGLALVARAGNMAPGTKGDFDELFSHPVLNSSGRTAFTGSLARASINEPVVRGIWSEGGGNGLALITRAGSRAPGTPAGVQFSGFSASVSDGPALNNNGQTAFRATLTGASVDLTNDDGIWTERGGSGLTLIAREGNAAPGVGPDVNFAGFSSNGDLGFNSRGQTAFSGGVTGTGVDGSNDRGIWSEGEGNGLALLASEGEQAPGTALGTLFDFSTFRRNLAINDNGHTAFAGGLQGIDFGEGIWSEGGGNGLELVARSGALAPGAGVGVNFRDFIDSTLVLNGRGQTAFNAGLFGPGIDSTNDDGIWAEDLAGNLELIAREGDQINISRDPFATDFRTISLLFPLAGNTGNGDGRPSSFNDSGQLVFAARFTDGSEGVFASNLVAVPEPGASLFLVSIALARLSTRRRSTSRAASSRRQPQ